MKRSNTLQFRQTGPNKTVRRRLLFLLVVFIAALAFFFLLQNRQESASGDPLASPTLPIVTPEISGSPLGTLYGYRAEMNAGSMRNNLLPLSEDQVVTFAVRTFGAEVSDPSYVLYSADGHQELEKGLVNDLSSAGNIASGSLTLLSELSPNAEYLLRLQLTTSGAPAYYYTRVIRAVECYEQDCLAFAQAFHDNALSRNTDAVLPYLEESSISGVDTNTLAHVTVTSPASQVCWGSFDGAPASDPVISFTDINVTFSTLEFRYQMVRNGDHGLEYYDVLEYFRIRVSPTQTYLLSYDRTMTQQAGTAGPVSDSGVLPLGITNTVPVWTANEPGTMIAYVQDGELFSYSLATGVRERVFSFLANSPTDLRSANNAHGIRLLSMHENGSLDFAVYGYMNAGEHEGHCGVSLFHYDAAAGICQEQLFLESTDDWPLLSATMQNAMYVSRSGHFYLMSGGALLDIDMATRETDNVVRGLSPSQYAVSESGRYFAYIRDGETADMLRVLDLETLEVTRLQADDGQGLRPLAFLGENLVYGLVQESDIGPNATGALIYPASEVRILEGIDKSKIQKTYEKPGILISSATVEAGDLHLSRVSFNGTVYVETSEDILRSNGEADAGFITALTETDPVCGTVRSLTLSTAVAVSDLQTAEPLWAFSDPEDALALGHPDTGDLYIVYVGSQVRLATTRASAAIALADSEMGVVIDNATRTVWSRSKPAYRNALGGFVASEADAASTSRDVLCLSSILGRENHPADVTAALLEGKDRRTILQEAMPQASILDLTGCTLRQTFYCIGQANPVYAVTGENDAILVIGYTANSVTFYDPLTDEDRLVSIEDAEALFAANGNVFLSYID